MAVRLQTDPAEIQILLVLDQVNCMDILITTASVLPELYSASRLEAMNLECPVQKLNLLSNETQVLSGYLGKLR